jgi:hypothetical protein
VEPFADLYGYLQAERERETESRRIMRYTTCNNNLTATKFPRQFPFVRLVKLGNRGGKKFGNVGGRN